MSKQKIFAITVAAVVGTLAFTGSYYVLGFLLDAEVIKNFIKKNWR